MQINDEFGLIIALIVINWSALTIAIKCREKIDYSRNILWGLNNNKKPKKKEPIKNPSIQTGKMDYLTGLWQQGLLSDEDYHNERKHFEDE